MGLLGNLFGGSELKKLALKKASKCYIDFADMPLKEIEAKLGRSVGCMEDLVVLSSQVTKNKYLQGCFYYDIDVDPVYFNMTKIIGDSHLGSTAFFEMNFALFKKIYQKTGRVL